MNDHWAYLRLLLVLGILALLMVAAKVYLGGIPVLGTLPGDIELDYPGGYLYLPIMSSIAVALFVTLLAAVLNTSTNNDR